MSSRASARARRGRTTPQWETVLYPPNGSPTDLNIVLRVVEQREESLDCLSLFFARPRGFAFEPGDWIDIRFPSAELNTGRTFSLSSAPSEQTLRITFKRGTSAFKRALEVAAAGDMLLITQYGTNGFRRIRAAPAFMIAGGIGIAPFRSMILDAIDDVGPPPIDLLYINRTTDFPFEAELRSWQLEVQSLNIHTIQTGTGQRVDRKSLGRLISDPEVAGPTYYVVGPPAMVDRTCEILVGLGIMNDRIRTDRFDGY